MAVYWHLPTRGVPLGSGTSWNVAGGGQGYTNSDQIQLLCPGGPLQIEVKGHLNANIMA